MKAFRKMAETLPGPVFRLVIGGAVALFLGFFALSVAAAADEAAPTVTIRGAIANIDHIGVYVVNGSFLQLYPCEITNKIGIRADKQGMPAAIEGQKFYLDGLGRLVPAAGVARTIFPDFGFFSFDKIRGLTPGGCYKICVLMLDRPYPGLVPVTGPDGKVREIIVPEAGAAGQSQDIVIDLSKEALIIPDPEHLPEETVKTPVRPSQPQVRDGFWD